MKQAATEVCKRGVKPALGVAANAATRVVVKQAFTEISREGGRKAVVYTATEGVAIAANIGAQAAAQGSAKVIASKAISASNPAGWAALAGEYVGGFAGEQVGTLIGGKTAGKTVGKETGSVTGAVGSGALVGGILGGPIGAGAGAAIGAAGYGIGKGVGAAIDGIASLFADGAEHHEDREGSVKVNGDYTCYKIWKNAKCPVYINGNLEVSEIFKNTAPIVVNGYITIRGTCYKNANIRCTGISKDRYGNTIQIVGAMDKQEFAKRYGL